MLISVAPVAVGQEPVVDPAEKRFRELDTDKDGKLSREEAKGGSGRLGTMFDIYDTLTDDFIDLDEYKVYYAAATGTGPVPDPSQKREPRPTVYRYGHLPKGLPAYFTDGDTDQDGQVSLSEWAAFWGDTSEAKLAEFKELDGNGDGLLTAEEYMRAKKLTPATLAPPVVAKVGAPVPPNGLTPPLSPQPVVAPQPVGSPKKGDKEVAREAKRDEPKKDEPRPTGERRRPGGGSGATPRPSEGGNPFNPVK